MSSVAYSGGASSSVNLQAPGLSLDQSIFVQVCLTVKIENINILKHRASGFADFLSVSWHYVQYNFARSTLALVASGVVQGSCTGAAFI
jgi:hypothetical protein